jgi:acyl-CoA thioesterase FadM
MAQIKLPLPDHFSFSTTIPIRITDVNYGGHVGNDTVLSLIHEIRMQLLQHYGYTELQFAGVSLIMSEVTIEFKKELFYGDVITAFATISNWSRIGFEVYYKLVKKTSDAEIIVAVARTAMLCYDYNKRKIQSVPAEALHRIKQ